MGEQLLQDHLTPCSPAELYASLRAAWVQTCQDSDPSRASLLTLLAHWGLETGFGHYMHCWNLGNKKHVPGDGHDYCQFACGEELPAASVQAGPLVQIVSTYVRNGVAFDSVKFIPPHPATSFVACSGLAAGTLDYFVGMRGRFRAAWPFVVAGDVAGFCHALRQQGYYTADEGVYTASVLRCYHQLDGMIPPDAVTASTDPAPPDVTSGQPDEPHVA